MQIRWNFGSAASTIANYSGSSATGQGVRVRIESTTYTAIATQQRAKLATFAGCRGSRKSSTATKNCRVGPIYWRKPMVESGRRRTAAPNMSKGTAVTMPDNESNAMFEGEVRAACGPKSTAIASGSRTQVSINNPCSEWMLICLRTNPYSPNEPAN